MSAATRVLAMVAGVALIQALWLANRYVAENYWKAAIDEDGADDDGESDDETVTP